MIDGQQAAASNRHSGGSTRCQQRLHTDESQGWVQRGRGEDGEEWRGMRYSQTRITVLAVYYMSRTWSVVPKQRCCRVPCGRTVVGLHRAERGAMPCPAMGLPQCCPPASAVPALSKEQGVATVTCDSYHWLACSFHHMFVCLYPSSLLITPHHLSLPLITPPSLITPYPLSSPLISPQPPSPPDRWRPTLTSTHGGTWWCSSLIGRLPPGVR